MSTATLLDPFWAGWHGYIVTAPRSRARRVARGVALDTAHSAFNATQTRRLPLFIASTFRDMDHERDLLNNVIVPAINARLHEAGDWLTTVYPVDLRWGIATDESATAQDREREILSVCRSEVMRCRPLFLGLVGDRYGWIIDQELLREIDADLAALRAQPLSVTALELLTAAEAGLSDGIAPAILHRVPADAAARDGSPAQGTTDTERLSRLLRHLAELGCTVADYRASWNAVAGRWESDDFVQAAIACVLAQINQLRGQLGELSWLDLEIAAQTSATEAARSELVGRDDALRTIESELIPFGHVGFLGDDQEHPVGAARTKLSNSAVVVTGPAGCGVSAVLAAAMGVKAKGIRESMGLERRRAFVHIGVTALSTSPAVVVLLLIAQLWPDEVDGIVRGRNPEELPYSEVLPIWLNLLDSLDEAECAMIVVDGVDRLDSVFGRPDLGWVPYSVAGKALFILGVRVDSLTAIALTQRPRTQVLPLGELSREQAKELVERRVSAAHKRVTPELLDALAAGCRLPAWLALASDLMLRLTADSYQGLAGMTESLDPQMNLRLLLFRTAYGLPQTLDGLREQHLTRTVDLFGEQVVPIFYALGVSRTPLRDEDLMGCAEQLGTALGALQLSLFRAALSPSLGAGREWQSVDAATQEAIARLLQHGAEAVGADVVSVARIALARHLVRLPLGDPVRERELPRQLLLLGAYRDFVELLTNPTRSTTVSNQFAVVALFEAPDIEAAVAGLCAATQTVDESLTLASLLLSGVVNAYPLEKRGDLVSQLRELVKAGRGGCSRSGATAGILDAACDDFHASWLTAGGYAHTVAWLSAAVADPRRATLADLPPAPPGWPLAMSSLYTLNATLALLQTFCTRAIMPGASPTSAEELDLAVRHLDAAAAVDLPEGMLAEARDLTAMILRATLVFLSTGDTDLESLAAIADLAGRASVRYNSEPAVLRIWSAAVRLWTTLTCARLTEDLDQPQDVALLLPVLSALEELVCELDTVHLMLPDDRIVSTERTLARMQLASLLEACEQHESAACYGVPAVSDAAAADLLGWDGMFVNGAVFVLNWVRWRHQVCPIGPVPVDPTGWIDHLLVELRKPDGASGMDDDEVSALAGMAAFAAMEIAHRLADPSPARRVVAFMDERRRDVRWQLIVSEIIDGLLEMQVEAEDALLPDDSVEEWLAEFDDFEDDVFASRFTVNEGLTALAAVREALAPYADPRDTRAALALFAALCGRIEGSDELHQRAVALLAGGARPTPGTHGANLYDAATYLINARKSSA